MASSNSLLQRLANVDRVGRVDTGVKPAAKDVSLSEAARSLPEHILAVTDPQKLNAQTPYFRCPAWADLPSTPYHLYCTRDGTPFPALHLHRFPFYLIGKSPVCDYVLEHPSVSSVHGVLVFHKAQGCFVLLDLGSTNGTKMNGDKIERHKPVPVPVGSVIRFGYSTRTYEVRAGAAPSSKRLREEQEEVKLLKQTRMEEEKREEQRQEDAERQWAAAATASKLASSNASNYNHASSSGSGCGDVTSTAAAASENHTSPAAGHDGTSASPAVAHGGMTEALPVAENEGASRKQDEEGKVEGDNEPRRLHLFHLVIKHKDLENRVSRGRANKNETITRSVEDAMEIARHVLRAHERECDAAARAAAGGFVPWTVEEFCAAVLEYSEVATKKRGDLGMVEEGTLSDEFDNIAFALRRHEVSQPVVTPMGVHLIYRCD